MAKPEQLPLVTPFSVAFGAALRTVMAARGITQTALGDVIGYNQGYVSERLAGKRPVDTDLIAGVAELAHTSPRAIVSACLSQMRAVPVVAEAEKISTAPLRGRGKRRPPADPG